MAQMEEIADIELSDAEQVFVADCWDGVQEGSQLSLAGLATLCETLGITMDTINVAMTGLGGDDLALEIEDFTVLMGRLIRSGAVNLPETADEPAVEATRRAEAFDSAGQTDDPDEGPGASEIAHMELTEKEEEFIGQCWDGVQESGRLDMGGLSALCETLGVAPDDMNVAVTGLGGEECTLDVDDFMILMGRLVRSGAVPLPAANCTPKATSAHAITGKEANLAWMSSMTKDEASEEGDESPPPIAKAGQGWMAAFGATDASDQVSGAAEDEQEEESSDDGEPGGDAASDSDDAQQPSTQVRAAGAASAWMAMGTMCVEDEKDDEQDDSEDPVIVAANAALAAKKQDSANAWMNSMAFDEDADETA